MYDFGSKFENFGEIIGIENNFSSLGKTVHSLLDSVYPNLLRKKVDHLNVTRNRTAMNSYMEFDIKHEEDPLTITEIKSEPQENKFSVKEESEDFDEHIDIKHEINPMSQLVVTMTEVEETQENVMKFVEDNENKSQEEQKNIEDEEINGLLLGHETCESYGKDLQEKSVCVQTEENVNPFPEFNNLDFCNKDLPVESNYTTRMYIYLGEKRYFCNFCTKTFTSEYFTRHIRSHTKGKTFRCTECKKSFSYKSDLVTHTRSHTNEKPFTCTLCIKSYSRKSDLVVHIRTHSNEKPFKCTICGKCFSRKPHLVLHIRTHTNEKPFTCTICRKSFCSKSDLVRHVRTHTNEKPFTCVVCSKSFSSKSDLAKHIRTHTNEKPFTCTLCSKSFSNKSYLATHIRTHTNEKPFTCTICRKSFSNKSNLAAHIRTHTNEKPFTCTICGKSFSSKSYLATHIRTHTNEKPFTCTQ